MDAIVYMLVTIYSPRFMSHPVLQSLFPKETPEVYINHKRIVSSAHESYLLYLILAYNSYLC